MSPINWKARRPKPTPKAPRIESTVVPPCAKCGHSEADHGFQASSGCLAMNDDYTRYCSCEGYEGPSSERICKCGHSSETHHSTKPYACLAGPSKETPTEPECICTGYRERNKGIALPAVICTICEHELSKHHKATPGDMYLVCSECSCIRA